MSEQRRDPRPAWADVTCWACRQTVPEGEPIMWARMPTGSSKDGWWGHVDCVDTYLLANPSRLHPRRHKRGGVDWNAARRGDLEIAEHHVRIEHRPAAQAGWLPKWWAVCSCGYRSTRRNTEVLAVETAVHHARKYRQEAS